MAKKKLNIESVQSELQASSFFHAPAPAAPAPPQEAPVRKESATPVEPDTGGKNTQPIDNEQTKMVQEKSSDAMTSRRQEVGTDVMTSLTQDINMKLWREIIEDTETHNSSLRMSAKEREMAEDAIRDLKRKYKVKTSMNEIARLGLLFLIHDFKRRGEQSIIAEVKKS